MAGLIRLVVYLIQSDFRALGFVADIILYVAAAVIVGLFVYLIVSRLRTPPLMWYLEKETGGAKLPGDQPVSVPLTPGSP